MRTMLKSKIHRATVTQADLHYVGSVTIDEDLLDAADLLPGEQVAIVDVTNGARLETYVIPGERGTGVIGINGAAAHLVHPGDLVILISYGVMDETEAKSYIPRGRPRRRRQPDRRAGRRPRGAVPGRASGAARAATSSNAEPCCSPSTSATARPSSPPSTARSGSAAGGSPPRRGPPPTSCGCSGAGCCATPRSPASPPAPRCRRCCPALRQLLDSLDVPVVLIGPGVRTGVPLHVDNPREVGVDRVVTALAAHEFFGTRPRRPRPAGRRRRLRHLHQRRRRRPRGPVPRRRARARGGGQPRRAGHPRRPAALGRAHRARRTRSGRTPSPRCSRAWCSASPAWSTGWSAGSPPNSSPSSAPRRSSSPPAGWPRCRRQLPVDQPSGSPT